MVVNMLCSSLNQASSKEEGDEPKKKKGKTEAQDDQEEVSVADPPPKRLRKVRMKTKEFDALAERAYADAEPLPKLSPAQRLQRYLEKQKERNGENIPSEKANAKDEAKKKRKTAENTEAKKVAMAKQIKKAEAEQSEKAKAAKKVKGKKAQSPEEIKKAKAKKERTPEQIEKDKARSRKCIAYGKAYREAEGTEEERRAMAQKVLERH